MAGVDEAGRGALFGPLVVAAVILPQGGIEGLKDSKLLSPRRREELFLQIVNRAIGWSFSLAPVEEIEEKNVLRATLRAMSTALKKLRPKPSLAIIDGPFAPEFDNIPLKPIIGADRIIPQVSAASILAKVIRDRIITHMASCFPGFALGKNKGYATQHHRGFLKIAGPTPFHRRNFVLKYKKG